MSTRSRSPRPLAVPDSGTRRPRNGPARILRSLAGLRRGGVYRLALASLGVWGAYTLVGSGNGLLQLRSQEVEEARLRSRYASVLQRGLDLEREGGESEPLSIERGIREKYLRSRPGEIVYRLRRGPLPAGPDSSAAGREAIERVRATGDQIDGSDVDSGGTGR